MIQTEASFCFKRPQCHKITKDRMSNYYTQCVNNMCITLTLTWSDVVFHRELWNCLNQHLRRSLTSEELLHICSPTEHPNTKQIHSFPPLLTRWSRPHRDRDAWERSEQLKADWHRVSNQLHKRVREPKMGMICSGQSYKVQSFSLISHYSLTHKWTWRVLSTSRSGESAVTAIRNPPCQEHD